MEVLEVAPLLDSSACREEPDELRRRAREHGYLYLRALYDVPAIIELRTFVLSVCERLGWLEPGVPPEQAHANRHLPGITMGHPQSIELLTAVLPSPQLDRVRSDPGAEEILKALLGRDLAAQQGDVCRVVFPNADELTTPPHQDGFYTGADRECWTVWTPLGNCPLALGPLAVLPGSHLGGLLDHARGDALHLGVPEPPAAGWAAGDLACGDALVFHQLTLHRALPNRSGRHLRLSVDCRYRAAPAGPA